jgi:hypothetical protein
VAFLELAEKTIESMIAEQVKEKVEAKVMSDPGNCQGIT